MISFVYFDVGGVVVKDFSGNDKWASMKRDLGLKREYYEAFSEFYTTIEQKEISIFRDVDSILPMLTEKFGLTFPKGYSMLTDFVNRFEPNTSLWPLIHKLRKKKYVGLLTNMYPRMLQAIKSRGLLPDIVWDSIVDSTEVKFKKPDKQIYEIAEEKAKTPKNEILFIDNSIQNIQAASDFGWQTFLYDSAHPEESSRQLGEVFQ
jgi:HAD superfamily hydrolase (TIGR01509 family)